MQRFPRGSSLDPEEKAITFKKRMYNQQVYCYHFFHFMKSSLKEKRKKKKGIG
jgi:hypothetical protein